MKFLDPVLDVFRGKAVTIPPMDGALKPNSLLDDAEVVAAALSPDNLTMLNGRMIYSSQHEIRELGGSHRMATAVGDDAAGREPCLLGAGA